MVLFGPKRRLGKIEREILESVSTGDLLIGMLCSARSSRRMQKIAFERARARYQTRKSIESLVAKGYVRRRGESISITNEGSNALHTAIETVKARMQNTVWDGKWRIVAYDIPARHNKLRDQVRYILKRSGFMKLHNSVWIYPYECRELSTLIKRDPRVRSSVLYGIMERIDGDDVLRSHFQLPL